MKLNDLIVDAGNYYAHFKVDEVLGRYHDETVEEHSDLVLSYYDKLSELNGLDDKVRDIVWGMFKDDYRDEFCHNDVINFVMRMYRDAIYYHDLGKVNSEFQARKMKNVLFTENSDMSSNHSLLSSLLYVELFDWLINVHFINEDIRGVLRELMVHFSYVISKHHGNLGTFKGDKYIDDLRILQGETILYKEMIGGYQRKDRVYEFEYNQLKDIDNYRFSDPLYPKMLWLLDKMLFSSIVTSDFMATYRYKNDSEPVIEVLNRQDVIRMNANFEDDRIIQDIRRYGRGHQVFEDGSINRLRSDMFLEAEDSMLKNIHNRIFYLEAPTGSGKTLTSLNLVLRLLGADPSMNKLQYIFSFNTLIDQTRKTFKDMLGEEFVVVNSLTEIRGKSEDEERDYSELVLQRQNMQYGFVMSSHVNLFNRLFSSSREANLSFINLANSVVVLDEIQSYRNEIWLEIIEMLSLMAEYLNIKFVIMSATLPNLSDIYGDNRGVTELITDREKYFGNKLFKDRVTVNYELLNNEYTRDNMDVLLHDFLDIYRNHGEVKYLVQFISKKSSRRFFNLVKDELGDEIDVIEITGDDNRYNRDIMIKKIKSDRPIIVVATQVIEAGVDIDMDVGLKDISMLDNEEQFLGRINRSCKRSGIVYFFDMDDAKNIYRDDRRVRYNLKSDLIRGYLESKNFKDYYAAVGKLLHYNSDIKMTQGVKSVHDKLGEFDFRGVHKHMELINSDTTQIFLDTDVVIDDEKLIGRDVWYEYVTLTKDKDMDYSERRIRLSKLREKMSYFTYNIFLPHGKKLFEFTYKFGDFYYIENGSMYMDEFDGISKLNTDRLLGTEGNGGFAFYE